MTSWRRWVMIACAAVGLNLPAMALENGALETGALPPAPLAPDSVEARLESLMASPGLVAAEKKYAADKGDLASAKSYYATRRYTPLWVNERGLNDQAVRALAEIARAAD